VLEHNFFTSSPLKFEVGPLKLILSPNPTHMNRSPLMVYFYCNGLCTIAIGCQESSISIRFYGPHTATSMTSIILGGLTLAEKDALKDRLATQLQSYSYLQLGKTSKKNTYEFDPQGALALRGVSQCQVFTSQQGNLSYCLWPVHQPEHLNFFQHMTHWCASKAFDYTKYKSYSTKTCRTVGRIKGNLWIDVVLLHA